MGRLRTRALAALAPLLALASRAQEPHRPLGPEELARTSPFSGVAVVEAVSTRVDAETGAVYTDARLRLLEAWNGRFPADVILTQVGGTHEGRRSAAVGWNYAVAPGAPVAFFAKPWKGPYFAVTGMRQGLFHVETGGRLTWEMDRRPGGSPRANALSLTLPELRERVGRALGRELPAPAVEPAPAAPPAPSEAGETPHPRAPSAPASAARDAGGRVFFAAALLLALAALGLGLWRRRKRAA